MKTPDPSIISTPEKRAEKLNAERKEAINVERERRVAAGVTITLSDGLSLCLQGRPEDQTNMLALKDTARDLRDAGVEAPVIPFRDGDNVIHQLTAGQMIEATDIGKQHVSAIYQAAWALKEMDPIPEDYSSDQYWPTEAA